MLHRSYCQPMLQGLGIALICALAGSAPAQESKPAPSKEEAAIRASAEAFVKAFDKGDAAALAAMWTESGTLLDERNVLLKGRKAIEEEYAALFKANPKARLEVAIQAIQIAAPNLAIEDGVATVITERGSPPTASRYSAVHVQEKGKWRLLSVRESGLPVASNFAKLQELEWLLGKWEHSAEGVTVQSQFRWIAGKSFLQRDYEVRNKGLATSSGTQIIGWDPQLGRVKSWSFDSSGGHGEGLWSPTPEGWLIETSGKLADGVPTSSRELYIRVADQDNVLGWRSFDRKVGDVPLPDTREIVLERVPEKR